MRCGLPVLLSLSLIACGREAAVPAAHGELDPAVAAALADPIMTDPDLASQNRGNAAVTLDMFGAVPLDEGSPEAVEAARAEAARLAGGLIRTSPEPFEQGQALAPAVTAGQVAAVLGAPADCATGLRYGYGWGADFPAALPIYPRGHVQEAAGSRACGVRAVVFTTPVDPAGVIDFYFTRADDAGYSAQRSRAGDVEILSGSKGASRYEVRVRSVNGLSQVELAVRG